MATAQRTVSVTTETRKVEVETPTITLVLTEQEAQALAAVTNRVGGSPRGPRGRIDSIRYALEGAGIRVFGLEHFIDDSTRRGSIYLVDEFPDE